MTARRRALQSALPYLALLALWAVFFWRFAAPNPADRLTYEPGDFTETFGLFHDLSYRAVLEGRLPLWTECLWSGYPLYADPQAQTYYPVKWLLFAGLRAQGWGNFPIEALVLETALHYLLTSLGLYAFLRDRKLRPAAALLGAVTFTYGGYLTAYAPLQNAVLAVNAWTPLALLAAGRLGETRTARSLAWAALALALAFLAGHPQTFLFAALITLAYFTYRYWAAGGRWRGWVGLGAALVTLTTLLAGAQLLPSLQFVANSTRASVPYEQAAHGFPFGDLAQLLVSGVTSVWSPLYVGLLPLALAVFALGRRTPEVRFWAGAALVNLVLSFGAPAAAYDAAYWLIPGLALFRGAERLALIFSLSLAVLAAFGADAALAALARPARRQLRALTAAVAGVALTALIALLIVAATGDNGVDWAGAGDRLGRWLLMAGLALAALLLRARVPAVRRWTPAIFVLVAVVDLFSAARSLNVRPVSQPYGPNPLIEPITAEAGFFRVQDDFRLPGHAGCAYGYSGVEGRTPYQIAGYAKLLERAPERVRWPLLGVRFVVTWRADLVDDHGQRIADVAAQNDLLDEKGNPTRTQRLTADPQRAWLARSVRVAAGDAVWDALNAPDFRAFDEVILPAAAEAAPGTGTVTVDTDTPGQTALTVQTDAPAVLVLSEPAFPGWQATLDGRPAPVLTADGALLGLAVPAGAHTVTLEFAPAVLGWGLSLSWLGLLLAGLLTFAPARLARRWGLNHAGA